MTMQEVYTVSRIIALLEEARTMAEAYSSTYSLEANDSEDIFERLALCSHVAVTAAEQSLSEFDLESTYHSLSYILQEARHRDVQKHRRGKDSRRIEERAHQSAARLRNGRPSL